MVSTIERDVFSRAMPMPRHRSPPRLSTGARPHGLAAGELVKLHHALTGAVPAGDCIIAQLVAPERDASITRIAYDLAYISASWLDKRVLYVNGTDMRMDRNDSPAGPEDPTLSTGFDPGDLEGAITRVVGLELYQMTFPDMRGALDLAPVLRRIPEFMDRLRQTFDLVVIASPAASEAPMGLLLSPYVDGNVLVVKSGRTRAPVAAGLRDSIRASGGSVIGVVLTRYLPFAPRWLRRWL